MTRALLVAASLALIGGPESSRAEDLGSGAALAPGQKVVSSDGRFILTLQTDGNLVWLRGNQVLWHSGTHGTKDAKCHMQADGNLVIYGSRDGKVGPVWSSNTAGHTGATLACQVDGNLVIYQGSKPVWDSKTDERVRIAGAFAGYELTLPKQQAEDFRDFLNANISEEQIYAFLKELVSDKRVAWRIKAIAAIVAADVILFKKKMNANMGPNGVVIRVWGTDARSSVCTTIAPDTWTWMLPNDWKKVTTTIPLYWTITPRQ